MVPQWASLVGRRIVAASTTPPSVQGMIGIAQGLLGFGICAAVITTQTTGTPSEFVVWEEPRPPISHALGTLARVLMVPSLVEEVIWRVAFVPHPAVVDGGVMSSFPRVPQALAVNALFTLSHLVGAHLLQQTGRRPGAIDVFTKPSFLLLAFGLGGACTFAYVTSGGALYAPVVVHAIPVTLWLAYFGGEKRLQGGHTLCATTKILVMTKKKE